jgi:peptidylprolyl isomerase
MPLKLKSSARKSRRNKKLFAVGFFVIIALIIGAVFVFGQSAPKANDNNTGNNSTGVNNNGSNNSTGSNETVKVRLQTTMGNITIEMRDDKPITTANFLNLTRTGIYDGVIFHRVIPNFMIQGGDPTGTGMGDPSIATILDEIGSNNRNVRGTIAMAKTSQPNSASSQFFINVVDNGLNAIDSAGTKFDSVYSVFGTVIQGMDVVDAISHVTRDANDKPLTNVTIIKAEVLP